MDEKDKAAAIKPQVKDKAAPDAPAPAEQPLRPLPENRLRLVLASAADIGNTFAAVTPAGTPFAHVKQPEFWQHVAYKLRPGDRIDVHIDDMTYCGTLYVRDVSSPAAGRLNNRAVVAAIAHTEFGALVRDPKAMSHDVKYMGPHQKWSVVRLKDNVVVKEGCGTEDEARAWRDGHLRAQAA